MPIPPTIMKKFSVNKLTNLYILFTIIIFAFILRIYGINWDQNQHLHPDERFLTMVTLAMSWPSNFLAYLIPKISTLNPYNIGYNFFVYGTLHLYLVKAFAGFIRFESFDYNNITLVGRLISALLDTFCVLLVYKISKNIFNNKVGMLAGFIYSISVLPIQLSHFFAVDTFLNFFLLLTFYLLIKLSQNKNIILYSILSGITFGFAIACKISALLFFPIIILPFCYLLLQKHKFNKLFYCFIILLLCSYLSLRISNPSIFKSANLIQPLPNPQFISNLRQLKSFDSPKNLYPPGVQWLNTQPLIFPLKNIILWGLGLPLGFLALASVTHSLFVSLKIIMQYKSITLSEAFHLLILVWVLLLFFYQGVQFSKTMRYFLPIYPFLAILIANFLYYCIRTLKHRIKNNYTLLLLYSLTLILSLVWPLSFLAIYSRPHSRVSASQWIYKNIPAGSTLSCEHWDDCLPVPLPNNFQQQYKIVTLELFNPDTTEKWNKINSQLQNIDYIIMSSNRLWGSIPGVPEKYPLTSKFYNELFAEKLGYVKIAEFTSYPTIPLVKMQVPDGKAEEAFTVYDHPKVLVFKKR